MKKLCMIMLALCAISAANATTYWARLTSAGSIPACLTFYSNETCTVTASVTPAANDGNTYVLKEDGTGAGSYATMLNNYTSPAGTSWVLGTQTTRPVFLTNSGTFNFGNATIYGMAVRSNNGMPKWSGVNTLVKSDKAILFGAVNGANRGFELNGTFIASETDVIIQLGGGFSCPSSQYILSGDFSNYKGKFDLSSGDGPSATPFTPLKLSLTSSSAFGASSVSAVNDYITVSRDAVTLVIDPAVTQYANKGITFNMSSDQTSYIEVASGKSLNLIAPIYGSDGTLAKTGAGTLTLATSVEMTNLSVDAGTLIVDSTASFAPGTTMTVSNGATVVSRVGSNIPNVTLNIEEGGAFSYDFTVPFTGTSVTTMDYTSLTAADRAALTKPIAITLSQKITLPQNTALNLAVARFSASAGFEAADFTDGTEKDSGLPNTSFSMSNPVDGVVTLTMYVKPVIKRNSNKAYSPISAQNTSDGTAAVWSDELSPHSGADYLNNWGDMYTHSGWDHNTRTFEGDSLYLTTTLHMKSAGLVMPPTTFAGDNGKITEENLDATMARKYSGGPFILPAGKTLSFWGVATWLELSGYVLRYDLEVPFQGEGNLTLSCKTLSTNPSYIKGDNSQLKGKVVVTHADSPSGVGESARLEVALGSSLGGAMDTFTADGITIKKYSIVRPRQTMTLNAANRGVTIDGYGGFEVAADQVLTIANPVALAGDSGSLIKMGAGSLKLDGAVTRSGANTIAVDEGWLTAPADDVANDADVVFAAGTGLEIDLTAVSENGLKLTRASALSFADSRLKVRFSNTAAAEEAHAQFSVAICTVPTGSSLTADSFAYVHSCKGYDVTIRKETLDGYDRFVADCVPKGIMLIVL